MSRHVISRLAVDRTKTYSRASKIAFTNVLRLPADSETSLEATKVAFDDEVSESGDGWLSFVMTGTLWLWFREETRLEMSKSAGPESTTTEE